MVRNEINEFKTKTVLVTGGAGFIGSHLVEELVKRRYRIKVLDLLTRGRLDYIQPYIVEEKVDFIDGDIRYKDVIDRAMKDVDYVFHEVATNINRSLAYPEEAFDINFRGSQYVFRSAIKHNVKKVIFASSASVYGEPKQLPMSENSILDPITPYCISKLASEYLLKFYSRSGLRYIIFRYFNVYGPRQHADQYYTSVIILFLKKLLNNEPPIIFGSGEQSLDFINVKDVVRANIMAMESQIENEIFNLGSGKSTSIKELAYLLLELTGKEIDPIFEPRDVLVKERRADVTKVKQLLGFEATINIRKGLKELVEDVLKFPEKY